MKDSARDESAGCGETTVRDAPNPMGTSQNWGEVGRHKAGTYGDLMGLAGGDLAKHLRFGTCFE